MTIGKITSNILLSHWKVVFGSHFLDTGLSYCTALCALIQKEAPQTQLLDSTPWQQTNHLQIYLFERKLETEGIVVMSYWGTDARIYLFLKHVCTKTSSKPHCCLHYVFIHVSVVGCSIPKFWKTNRAATEPWPNPPPQLGPLNTLCKPRGFNI